MGQVLNYFSYICSLLKDLFLSIKINIYLIMKRIWIWLVKLCGWHFDIPNTKERPEILHCVVAVAPHTSVADFFVGAAVLFAAGSNPRIFIKKEFFNFITSPILRRMGAVAVDRGNRSNGLVNRAVEVLTEDDMNSAVTGDLGYGSYVITTSNAPIKNGDMVRLADNG